MMAKSCWQNWHWCYNSRYGRHARVTQIMPDWYRIDCYIPDEMDDNNIIHHQYSHAEHANSYRDARIKAEAWVINGYMPEVIQPRLFN